MSDYLFKLTEKEEGRQKSTISLIASENLPSPAVIDLLGGSFESKQIIGKMVHSAWRSLRSMVPHSAGNVPTARN